MNSYFEGRETISLNENFEFNKMEFQSDTSTACSSIDCDSGVKRCTNILPVYCRVCSPLSCPNND